MLLEFVELCSIIIQRVIIRFRPTIDQQTLLLQKRLFDLGKIKFIRGSENVGLTVRQIQQEDPFVNKSGRLGIAAGRFVMEAPRGLGA